MHLSQHAVHKENGGEIYLDFTELHGHGNERWPMEVTSNA